MNRIYERIIGCSIEGCTSEHVAKGLCSKHYQRKKKAQPLIGSIPRPIKHGLYASKTYKIWSFMKSRCGNPNSRSYEHYGARGIEVCERWKNQDGFINFLKDMGEKPRGLSIDRIDNNGNYEPSNCRWATGSTQMQNRRIIKNKAVPYIGVRLTTYSPKRYNASARFNYTVYSLGSYETPEEAAIAYDCAVIQLRGNLAQTNIL